MSGGLTPFYGMWRQYNARVVDKIRSLSDEQLKLRARPDYWPIWAIAAHTAGTRVYWLCGVFKESGADTTPFTDRERALAGRMTRHAAWIGRGRQGSRVDVEDRRRLSRALDAVDAR